jgi:hypothetical protein
MSEGQKASHSITTPAAASLWPTYALRAWLSALLLQTQQAEAEIQQRIEGHEREIDRLRVQIKRSAPVITSLGDAIGKVDEVLRRKLDTELPKERPKAATASPAPEPGKATEHRKK